MIETLLIDLDNTLIPSGHTYFIPQLNCAKIITMELQPDCPQPVDMIEMQDTVRKDLMARPGPIETHVFAQSWIVFYTELCEKVGRAVNPHIVTALGLEAMAWLQKDYQLYEGAADTLKNITQKKIIITLGTLDVQTFKAEVSGAKALVDGLEVVDAKVQTTYEEILQRYNLDRRTTAMVGDNIRLDIMPVLDCKMKAFHIVGKFDKPMIRGSHPYYTPISSFNEITKYL